MFDSTFQLAKGGGLTLTLTGGHLRGDLRLHLHRRRLYKLPSLGWSSFVNNRSLHLRKEAHNRGQAWRPLLF